MKKYEIYVTGKHGIFDPPGRRPSVASNLGYNNVESLKIGKFIQMTTEDDVSEDDVRAMCTKLLANPVIEDFSIKYLGEE